MKKLFKSASLSVAAIFVVATVAYAQSLFVNIEKPKSTSSTKDFKVGFVALDVEKRAVVVTCFVRRPGEGFVSFETHNLPNGGSSGNCNVDGGEVNDRGTFDFYVSAQAGAEIVNSATVSVTYDDVGPGTPSNYSKSKEPDGCSYKINYRTADDGGETVKVALYRSDSTNFSIDNSTKVQESAISSNQDGTFFANVPDCSKTYFFAIRAFDSAGIGSGVVGDPEAISTTTSQLSGTPQEGGAILASTSQVGSDEAEEDGEDGEGEVLADTEESDIVEDGANGEDDKSFVESLPAPFNKWWVWPLGIVGIFVVLWILRKILRK